MAPVALRIPVFAEVPNFPSLPKILPKGLFLKLIASFARNCFNCAKCFASFAAAAFAAASTGPLKRDLGGVNGPVTPPTPGCTLPGIATFGNCGFFGTVRGMARKLALFGAALRVFFAEVCRKSDPASETVRASRRLALLTALVTLSAANLPLMSFGNLSKRL